MTGSRHGACKVRCYPTAQQQRWLEGDAHMRRIVRNRLIKLDEYAYRRAVWQSSLEYAAARGLTPRDVFLDYFQIGDRLYAEFRRRKAQLEADGFPKPKSKGPRYADVSGFLVRYNARRSEACAASALGSCVRDYDRTRSRIIGARAKGESMGGARSEGRHAPLRVKYQIPTARPDWAHGSVALPGVRGGRPLTRVRCAEDPRGLMRGGRATAATYTRDAKGRWFVALTLCEMGEKRDAPDGGVCGIDLNVSAHVLSDGTVYSVPLAIADLEPKIAAWQRDMARREKGSVRWKRARVRVASLKSRQASIRKNFVETLAHEIATRYKVVVVEGFSVASMTRSAKGTLDEPGRMVKQKSGLNRAILNASFGAVRDAIKRKVEARGGTFVVADQWFASSKICSACGHKAANMPLSVRVYECAVCGFASSRDHNAAVNLRKLYEFSSSDEAGCESRAWRGVLTRADDGSVRIAVPRKSPAMGEEARSVPLQGEATVEEQTSTGPDTKVRKLPRSAMTRAATGNARKGGGKQPATPRASPGKRMAPRVPRAAAKRGGRNS